MKEITREQMKDWRDEIVNDPQSIDMLSELTDKINKYFSQPEPKKFEVWKPKDGECYFIMNGNGKVERYKLIGTFGDKLSYSIGNCFKTEQDALNHVKHLKAKKKLQDELAVMNAEANGGVELLKPKFFLQYDLDNQNLSSSSSWITYFPLHVSYIGRFDNQTTIGTLTEEEVRLAFGVFE